MIECSSGFDEEEDRTNWKSRNEEAEEERQVKGQRRKPGTPCSMAVATEEKPTGEETLEAEKILPP